MNAVLTWTLVVAVWLLGIWAIVLTHRRRKAARGRTMPVCPHCGDRRLDCAACGSVTRC